MPFTHIREKKNAKKKYSLKTFTHETAITETNSFRMCCSIKFTIFYYCSLARCPLRHPHYPPLVVHKFRACHVLYTSHTIDAKCWRWRNLSDSAVFLLLLLFYCSLLAASGCVCCICDNIQILLSLESFATLFHVHVRMCVRVHVLPLAESTMHSIFMFDFVSQINSVRHFKRIQIIPFSR